MKRNEGFTLVELLVAFAVGAVVVLAATSVLLLGLRFNAISGGTAQRQNTTRILMTVFENLATEQQITKVTYTSDSWDIIGSTGTLLSYEADEQTIYSGNDTNKSVLVEDVIASYVKLEGSLLSFHVETKDGSYSSSVYCRNELTSENTIDLDKKIEEVYIPALKAGIKPNDSFYETMTTNQLAFLSALVGELGSTGKIVGDPDGTYYSEFYDSNWPPSTPWCGCFVYWGLKTAGVADPPRCANVDLFKGYFQDQDKWFIDDGRNPLPGPGDVVFFDWDNGVDPEHIGVVLYVDSSTNAIYTIEGNSAGIVAVRKYSPTNIEVAGQQKIVYDYIIGYGKLPWT